MNEQATNDLAVGVGGGGFNAKAIQIKRGVDSGWPPLQRYLGEVLLKP